MKDKKQKLAKFIEAEISYDSSVGKYCPQCNYMLNRPYYWIDHKSSFAANITAFLGFKVGCWEDNSITGLIYKTINNYSPVTGERQEDAQGLSQDICDLFYNKEAKDEG